MPPQQPPPDGTLHSLVPGLYELLLTERVTRALDALNAESRRAPLSDAEAPAVLAHHMARVIERALRALPAGEAERLAQQVALCNEVIELLDRSVSRRAELATDQIRAAAQLLAIWRRDDSPFGQAREPRRPSTPLAQDALLVRAPGEPSLANELQRELDSADQVDLLCAFVVWTGVRVLLDDLRRASERGARIRVLTTTYTGTTEVRALEALRDLGAEIKVSYETRSTRLHAKAWLFERDSGFSTAYVGSSNLTHTALHDGLEWNVRLSEASSPGLLERFRAAFETYWADPHFEPYLREQFAAAVQQERSPESVTIAPFDVRPFPYQARMLDRLTVERERFGRNRNLLVAATGTGKTVVSALDYRRLAAHWGGARLLFVAHRREILDQSRSVFRAVMRDGTFGELYVNGLRPVVGDHVFASVQSLRNIDLATVDAATFDMVIVDEFHHAAAPTYRRLLEHLRPRVLLGMTATPERADADDILHWFDGRIDVELRLWDALEQGLLCPFQYFGVADDVDVSAVAWQRGGYDLDALSRLYTGNDARLAKVLEALQRYVRDVRTMRALGFCVSVAHATWMAERFNQAGIPATVVSGETRGPDRVQALRDLRQGRLNVIFAVDVFNEGVDVPEIDTVLLLRPTESATVFLQQLGRGLRLSEGKTGLTVLDFIGQQRREFRFETRFAALTGQARGEVLRDVAHDFPRLPAGCSIRLDRVARQIVLENLKGAIARAGQLARELRACGPTSLRDFMRQSGRTLNEVYRAGGWCALQRAAGFPIVEGPDQARLERAVGRLRHLDDDERVALYTRLLTAVVAPDISQFSERERRLLTMLHVGLWGRAREFASLQESLTRLWPHVAIRDELLQLLPLLAESATSRPLPADLGTDVPLLIHQRYSRDEIHVALGDGTAERPPVGREGVRWLPASATDVFFVTLQKAPGQFSPTTMYRDYAISPDLFHWESQSTTSESSQTGQRYIHHAARGSRVLLAVRETSTGEHGGAQPFVFLGPATYVQHRGERPMAITWKLHHEMPAELYQVARTVA